MIFLFLAACSVDKTQTEDTSNALTWTKDLQPIVEQHCVRCHQDGEQGTGDFTDFDTVSSMAELMLNAVNSGTMPPAVADPNCHDYVDSDKFYMPDASKAILAQWIDDGKTYGSEDDIQEYDRSTSGIKNPDLTITIPEPYTPTFTNSENPGNDYRCFSIKHNQTEPFYVTDLYPTIDNAPLVHHVVLGKGNENGILPGSDAPEGVDCIEGSFTSGDYQDAGMLAGWAPGGSPVRFPENAGLVVNPDEYIIIQIHYYQSVNSTELSDQSGYVFKTTTEAPENVVRMIPAGIFDFEIPAGDESYTESDSIEIPIPIKIWGVFPHMHILGAGYEVSFEDECIIRSDQYDFNNQLSYMYEEPIEIPANTPIDLSCTWNNSDSNPYQINNPPADVYYGERTDEEMCFAFMMVSF